MQRIVCFPAALLALGLFSSYVQAQGDMKLLRVDRIWNQGRHNAFTDLTRYQDRWICVFREATAHVSPDGKIRVLSSADGQTWESAALISGENTDLRDPKICTNPDGRLMLLAAASWHQRDAPVARQPVVYFSNDASHWGKPAEVGEANYWLWRVTWHGQQALGIGYGVGDRPKEVRLYSTTDGLRYDTVVPSLYQDGYPNESALVFADNTCLCLLRRDDAPHTGLIGTAKAPYHQWQWKPLPVRIGGPQMIRLPDGRLLAAVRLYEGGVRTSLCWVDPEQGRLTEAIDLPSAGDTSYAGMVLHDGILWVSYYSSHEGKTSIYLAQVQITG